jgi:hypothetical protein
LPDVPVLSMDALKKVKQLVSDGATVVGERPLTSMSLSSKENKFKKLCNSLWADTEASGSSKRHVMARVNARSVLTEQLKLGPDVEFRGTGKFDYIHRINEALGMDLYFVSSQNAAATTIEISFRVTNRVPELFDPMSGEIKELPGIIRDKRMSVQLQFDPYGSAFVIFRKRSSPAKSSSLLNFRTVHAVTGPWTIAFDTIQYKQKDLATDTLINWKHSGDSQLRYYSGKGVYATTFKLPAKENGKRYFLRLNSIEDVGIARMVVNGTEAGITWAPPFRLEITNQLKEGLNEIKIEVINSWRNRLVGDRDVDPSRRYTKTNITIRPEWQLLDAGLLGPVVVEVVD